MNKKAQFNYILALMLGVTCFFLGLALANPMTDVIGESMNNEMLNCTNSSVTGMQQAICTQMDIFPAIFLGLLMGLGGALAGGFLGG